MMQYAYAVQQKTSTIGFYLFNFVFWDTASHVPEAANMSKHSTQLNWQFNGQLSWVEFSF
jgi:hypothetical protein